MRAPLLIYAALGLVLLFGAYEGGWHRIGGQDWNFFLSQSQAEVSSLQHWGQFPLWAPWRRGGQVCFAQAQSLFLSPVTPLALAFGVVAAYKLLLLPIFLCGCLGLHALAGQLRLAGLSRMVPALVFFGSSIYPLHVRGGLPNYLCAFALLPWILYALRRARGDLRWLALAALLDAGLFFCGGIYQFVFFPLLLLLDGAAEAVMLRSARPLLLLCAALLAALCLAAPRLLPVADVYAQYPRPVAGSESYLSLPLVLRAWLDPQVPDIGTPQSAFVVTDRAGVYWIYAGAFVGPLALLFAAAGLRAWRRTWGWALAGAVFLWLALGSGASPSLWDGLHALPVFASMRFPERLLALTTFCVALLAGHGFQQFETWVRARLRRTAGAFEPRSALVLAALVVPSALVNAPLSREAFDVDPTPGLSRQRNFRQELVKSRPQQWGGEVFESVLANVGNPNGMSDIPTPPAVRAAGEPGYRGEVYLLAGRGSVLSEVTPNVITVQCQLDEPDVLVVNQNYFPGWRALGLGEAGALEAGAAGATSATGAPSDVELVNREDLLALPLPAGHHNLRLVYAPASVPRGFLLGGAAALVTLAWWLVRTRRAQRAQGTREAREARAARGAPEDAARAGRLEVAVLALYGGIAAGMGASLQRPAPAPLAEELSWTQGAALVDARASDEDVRAGRAFRDIAAALEHVRGQSAAGAIFGARVVLRPGTYDGFRLDQPALIAAVAGGPVTLRTRVEVSGLAAGQRAALISLGREPFTAAGGIDVHDGAGCLLLQSMTIATQAPGAAADASPATGADLTAAGRTLGAGSACPLEIQRWGRVELLGCTVRPGSASPCEAAVRVREASLVSVRSTIDGGSVGVRQGAAGLVATDALLLLEETVVRGGEAAASDFTGDVARRGGDLSGGPGLRLHHSRLVGSSANQRAWRGGTGAPAFTLARASLARVSGVDLQGAAPWVESGSSLDVAGLPQVTLHQSRFFGGSVLQLDLSATPGTQGRVIVSLYTALEATRDPLAWLQFDVTKRFYSEPVAIPESGALQHLMHIPFDDSVPGRGIYVQFVAEKRPGSGAPAYSLMDGAMGGVRLPLP